MNSEDKTTLNFSACIGNSSNETMRIEVATMVDSMNWVNPMSDDFKQSKNQKTLHNYVSSIF